MKTITILCSFFLFLNLKGQVLTENFDTNLNWTVTQLAGNSTNPGWLRVTQGDYPLCSTYSGAGMAKFSSFHFLSGNSYAMTSPSFNLNGSSGYRVNFYMHRDSGYPTAADKIEVFITNSPTTNGTLIGTVHRSTSLTPAVSSDGWYQYQFNVPASTNGISYLRFVGTGDYGHNTFIDEVSVNEIQMDDLFLSEVNIDEVFLGNVAKTVSGTIINNGSNIVNTAVINWQADSGAINSQNLTGLNLAAGGTYNFSHNVVWTPIPNTYSLKVWVSLPNGNTDGFVDDNEIIKEIRVASNSTSKKPLYEKFTSSTCNPCAYANTNVFTPFYTSGTNSTDLCLINYQMDWPGNGDPYYTAEGGVRKSLYGVGGVPDLYVNGKLSSVSVLSGNASDMQTALNNELQKSAYFSLNAVKSLNNTTMNVQVTTTPYISGEFKLHVVVVEKTTTGNVGTNGETSFKNVMMKMMPDANGTVLNTIVDTPIVTNLTFDLSTTNVEEYSDLEVIAFIQDPGNNEVMNAAFGVDQLSVSSFGKLNINVYPNPSNGLITIDTELPVQVQVVDVSGKIVFEKSNVTHNVPLNLTELQKGVYLLKLKNIEGLQVLKIMLN